MQELQRHARLAEQKAAACRVAQSPLSRLAWVSAKPQQAPLSTSSPESPVTATAKLSDWAAPEFDMEPDTFDREIDAEMFGLELVAQGGA